MNHDWTLENLDAYLAGGLSADERHTVEAHVNGCAECADMADARKLEQTLDAVFAEGLAESRFGGASVGEVASARFRRATLLRFTAAAAAVLVVGLLGRQCRRLRSATCDSALFPECGPCHDGESN